MNLVNKIAGMGLAAGMFLLTGCETVVQKGEPVNKQAQQEYDEDGRPVIKDFGDLFDRVSERFVTGGGFLGMSSRQAARNGDANASRALRLASRVQREEYDLEQTKQAARTGAREGASQNTAYSEASSEEYIQVFPADWIDYNGDGRLTLDEVTEQTTFLNSQKVSIIIKYCLRSPRDIEVVVSGDSVNGGERKKFYLSGNPYGKVDVRAFRYDYLPTSRYTIKLYSGEELISEKNFESVDKK